MTRRAPQTTKVITMEQSTLNDFKQMTLTNGAIEPAGTYDVRAVCGTNLAGNPVGYRHGSMTVIAAAQ
jgi:hypothetical protein